MCSRNLLSFSWSMVAFLAGLCCFVAGPVRAQPELAAWGNLTGIRMEGQLMEFGTSLCTIRPDGSTLRETAKERQNPRFDRQGDRQIVTTNLDSLFFTITVEDIGSGAARMNVELMPHADTEAAGAYLCVQLPEETFSGATAQLIGSGSPEIKEITLSPSNPSGINEYLKTRAQGVRIAGRDRQLEITLDQPAEIRLYDDRRWNRTGYLVRLPIAPEKVVQNQPVVKTFTFETNGTIDRSPIEVVVDPSRPGRLFAGLGGNFRLQNPRTDPPVIDYNLNNLRVAYARVEMPWRFWQPDKQTNPLEAARAGKLHPAVRAAMEMAQRLHKMGMPVIVSAWGAPAWAIQGTFNPRPKPGEPQGNPLRSDQMPLIYASITSYLEYLKETFGVEAEMFSFNESDIGIYVLQTGEEHAGLIKGLGAFIASKGLQTKMLLGDTGDANGYPFILSALADRDTYPYIGAVSFHSWRGWADTTLSKWAQAAQKLDKPLIIGEGSIDAAAWRYPIIFQEPAYAQEEINLYVRMMAICQPLSILQWQLTADYSVLSGGGVFGNETDPLYPTRRFFNLKQLAATPVNARFYPTTCGSPTVTCAALGDPEKGTFALHLVNNGAARQVVLSGLPAKVTELYQYVTDDRRNMEKTLRIPVSDGQARFLLDRAGYTTVTTSP